jgi:hypothetical protein
MLKTAKSDQVTMKEEKINLDDYGTDVKELYEKEPVF